MMMTINRVLNAIGLGRFTVSSRFSSEKLPGEPPTEGRAVCRLYERVGEAGDYERASIKIEWNLTGGFYMGGVKFYDDSDDGDVQVFVGFGPTVWVDVGHWRLRRLLRRIGLNGSRRIEISAHDGIVWWNVFCDENRWSASTPRWRNGDAHVTDALLGKQTSQVLAETHADVVIPMPEKSYPAKIVLQTVRWSRPRWLGETVRYAEIEIPGGIPFSGKGETGYDLDEDGLFGLSTQADSIGDAIGKVVASVYEYRARRGDPWRYDSPDRAKLGGKP